MEQHRRIPGSMLAATFGLASAVAVAGPVTAEARLGAISVQLIDLDTTDSVTPSITFLTDERGAEYSLAGSSRNGGDADFWFIAAQPNAWADFTRAESTGGSHAEVAFTSPGTLLGSTMSARASIQEIPLPGVADLASASVAHEITLNRGSFLLSANTKAVFTAEAFINGVLSGTAGQIASSSLGVSIRATDAEYFPTQYDEKGLSKTLSAPPPGATVWDEQRLLTVSVSNLASTAQTRYFGAYLAAYANLQGPVRPVPEAGSLSLMLLGLAALPLLRRGLHRIAPGA